MQAADGKEKKALTLFISHVHDREQTVLDARSTVADRFRVGRFIPRTTYDKIVEGGGIEPTYHQIRACIFTNQNELDPDKTNTMIDYAVANSWPTVEALREYRAVLDPKASTDPVQMHWQKFVKYSQIVMRDVDPGTPHYVAAEGVFKLWASESGVNLK
jgi:hypothetical protein